MRYVKRYTDGIEWNEVELSAEDVDLIQRQHDSISKAILIKCIEDVSTVPKQLALFDKRCPSFMELINAKLDEIISYKLKRTGGGKKVSKRGDIWDECPYCHTKLKRGYNKEWKYYCGKCQKYKIAWTKEEEELRKKQGINSDGDDIQRTVI